MWSSCLQACHQQVMLWKARLQLALHLPFGDPLLWALRQATGESFARISQLLLSALCVCTGTIAVIPYLSSHSCCHLCCVSVVIHGVCLSQSPSGQRLSRCVFSMALL